MALLTERKPRRSPVFLVIGPFICLSLLAGGAYGVWRYLIFPVKSNPVVIEPSITKPSTGQSAMSVSPDLMAKRRAAARSVAGAAMPGKPAAGQIIIPKVPGKPIEVPPRGGDVLTSVGQPPKPDQRLEATLPTVVDLSILAEPPLEAIRQRDEAGIGTTLQDSNFEIRVEAGFDSGTRFELTRLSPTHFQLDTTKFNPYGWFMFRLTNAKGRTVRFDILNHAPHTDMWLTLKPVFAYGDDPSDPRLYPESMAENAIPHTLQSITNSKLPIGGSGRWNWISQTWRPDNDTFSFVQRFEEGSTFVAMRFPRPAGYNQRFFERLADNPTVKVIEVGKTLNGRPLMIAQIGETNLRTKPCVLIYGGEHADEPDGMWATQGALEHVLGNSEESKLLRERLTFLIIPTLDPDGTARGVHSEITTRFMNKNKTVDSVAYANWFQTWVGMGNRLDLVVNYHCVQTDGKHASIALMEWLGERGKISRNINEIAAATIERAGFTTHMRTNSGGWSPDRLSGWLSRRYGPVALAYEINCQSRDGHLSIDDMTRLGAAYVDAYMTFFNSSPDATELLTNVDAWRAERAARWTKYGPVPPGTDAIEAEAIISKGVGLRTKAGDELMVEKWVP